MNIGNPTNHEFPYTLDLGTHLLPNLRKFGYNIRERESPHIRCVKTLNYNIHNILLNMITSRG